MKTIEIINNVLLNNVITEKEISLLKKRKNAGEKFDESFSWDNEICLTPEQNKKAIDFLLDQWKTPKGVERKNSPFGYREEHTLETFTHFEFRGFYDAGNYHHVFFLPLYVCVGTNSSFEYYYNGKVNIIG